MNLTWVDIFFNAASFAFYAIAILLTVVYFVDRRDEREARERREKKQREQHAAA